MLAAVALGSAASPATSQQLVVNGGFDVDLQGWSPFGATGASVVEWSSDDADGNPASGSLHVVAASPDPSLCSGLIQSGLPIEGGKPYHFGGDVLIPEDQPFDEFNTVDFELQFYASVGGGNCSNFLGGGNFVVTNATPDGWTEISLVVEAPSDAVCARYVAATCKDDAGGAFEAFTDNAFVRGPEIFADGFEAGDLLAWSGVVP